MNREEVITTAQRLGPLASFCTVGFDGTPHVIPLVPVWIGSDLVFGARVSSLKVRQLRQAPRAAVQYVTPGEMFPDALLLKGQATIVESEEAKRELWNSGHFEFLTQVYDGPGDPSLCFIRFTPDRASLICEAGRGSPERWRAGQ
jgi:general stress protein 26